MEEAIGTQTQPPGRAMVKQSASPPPSAAGSVLVKTPASRPPSFPGPTTPCPPPSAPSLVVVEPPASSPPSAPAPSLVKPPATPPQRAPARREASASPAPTTDWLLLDRFVHRSRRHRGVFGGDATTSEMSYDCVGRCIRVSLRVADPPLVSRLYVHWTVRPAIKNVMNPYVIAAHRHSILFRVTVPFEDPSWWHVRCCFPIDYFVYSAATVSTSSSSLPSLTRLPPCFDPSAVKMEQEYLFQPYRRQKQRSMMDQEMGLLCHGEDGEFIVADLIYCVRDEVELCLLHHPSRASGIIPTQWKVKKLPVPPDMKINCSLWTTDTVFPIGDGGFMCWVDYYQGMLLVDVLLLANNDDPDQQQQLRYIPLPKQALKWTRPYKDAFCPDPFRHVCISDAGIVKLVCILTKISQPTFTIVTWSLNIHKGIWVKDCSTIVGDSEFFGMFDAAQSNLPRLKPSFPVVSLADPNVICFLLKEVDEDHNTYWVIEVNMRERVLQSTALYIRAEEEEGYSPEKPRWNFYGQYFVPSRFSSYLGQDDFKSQELSVLMEEKAKQRRAMHKEAKLENLLIQKKTKQR